MTSDTVYILYWQRRFSDGSYCEYTFDIDRVEATFIDYEKFKKYYDELYEKSEREFKEHDKEDHVRVDGVLQYCRECECNKQYYDHLDYTTLDITH